MKKKFVGGCFALLLVLLPFAARDASAATTEILSMSNDGKPGSTSDRHTWTVSGISNDGRYAVFVSSAKLTADDVDPIYHPQDIYLRDRIAGTTTLLTPTGFYGTAFVSTTYGNAAAAQISGDGNYVALIATRQEEQGQDYVYDLLLIDRISGDIVIAREGEDIRTIEYAIDYDGDLYYVDNANIYTGGYSIYKYDRQTKQKSLLYSSNNLWARSRISVNDAGTLVSFSEYNKAIYASLISVYLLDVPTGNKTLISRTIDGSGANGNHAKISKSGDYVIFHSTAPNLDLVPYPTLYWNLFLYDVKKSTVEKLTFNDPQYGYFYPTQHPYNLGHADVSDDGRFIAVVLTDVNYFARQYGAVLDRQTGKVEFLPDGTPANNMLHPVITPDGRYVVSTGITPSAPNGVYTLLYDRYGSNQAFAVDAGLDKTIEQETPYGAYATLTGELTAGTCTGDQTYRWTWPDGEAIGTNPTIFLPPGTTTVKLDWSGCGETALPDTVNVTVEDNTPPSIAITNISGTAGNAGWYRSTVAVQLTANDNGSGVAAIYYTLDGVETMVADESATIAVNGDGEHQISYWAVDNDENSSVKTAPVQIQIDSIAPVMSGAVLTQANANGWYNTNVAVHFSATDTLSGVASVTPDMTVSSEGAGQSVTGTAFDVAGNRADYNIDGINLDRTAPLIAVTGVENGTTYNLGLVPQAAYTASDLLSGIAGSTGETTGTPDAFGCGIFTYTVTAIDKAGNTAVTSVTYEVKATPQGTSALIEELINSGVMSAQTAATLLDTLTRALSTYSSNPNLGDNMMNTFQNQINAALNSGKISSATATLLKNAADYIMLKN